ncbi:MAG: dihydrolipoyl dehydrogenase [Phycisphaerales bacterium]|nr:dihydrolipoyl dehydrogenase [Phycisphaerales bacterium]
MEAFESGILAHIAVKEGQKVKVGGLLAVIAAAGEKADQVKQQYSSAAQPTQTATAPNAASPPKTSAPVASKPAPSVDKSKSTGSAKTSYNFDLIVIGGGPAGYAAAIRAGQLKKRVLCVERDQLGGICLNWGCIPTKALLENGAFIRKLREDADEWGVHFDHLKIDFDKIIARSRGISEKLSKGIAHLFRKYEVKHEVGTGQLLAPHRVKLTAQNGSTREFTADHIMLATGARAKSLPGIEFDGKKIISAKEAMTLPKQPKKLAIIGAGAIGCEFADFYSAIGTQVEIVELMDHLLPIEDTDVSLVLERLFAKRGIAIHTKTKTDKVEKTADGVRLQCTGGDGKKITIDADLVLMAVGVTGNVENLATPQANLELFKNHVKVDKQYRTNVENVWAVGDVNGPPWLAHVAHHEAVNCVERIFGVADHAIDYRFIPGCTYTHPQVASMGLTERKAREENRQIRIGKFPFNASGRALASGESDGFVKLIFDAQYGELLGAHLIGENVTELLAELLLARRLEATEDEIIETMHPHPTLSEAVMEAAGVAEGRAIHL